MNGRYVHVSSSWREEKEQHIYSLKSVCFYEKQTPLQYLHVLLWFFFFLSSFYPVVKRVGLYWKAFIATKISYTFSCLGGNKAKSLQLINVKLWTAICHMKNRHNTRAIHIPLFAVSQTCWGSSMYTFHPSTLQTHCKQDIGLPKNDKSFREGCFV